MSILTEVLPEYVRVGGTAYPVKTDFRVWLEFDNVVNSKKIKPENKAEILMRICFDGNACRVPPEPADKAVSALYGFYAGERKGRIGSGRKRFFSLERDAEYIYSAFLTQYGIDLLSVPYMHWYVFCALLGGLEEDRRLMKIISLRSVNPSEIKDGRKRNAYRRLQDMYALEDERSDEEKEFDTAEMLYEIM